MATSLVYRNAFLYTVMIRLLYGRHFDARYQALAELIPRGASVLDLCCGPPLFYERYLRSQDIDYCGVDFNDKFINALRRLGARAERLDLRNAEALPRADYVLMQASLYHFLPDPIAVVEKMVRSANRQVIISETVRNLATSGLPLISTLGRRCTDPGLGRQHARFTEQTLDAFFTRYASRIARSFLIPGGREKVYVLNANDA